MHHLRIGCGAVSTRRGKGARIGGVNAQRLRHQAPTRNLANSSSSRDRPARTPIRSTQTRRIPALNPRQLGLRSARPRRAGSTRCSSAPCWASGRRASRASNVIRSQSASSRSWPCWARSARRWCCARMGRAATPMPPPAPPLSAASTRPALTHRYVGASSPQGLGAFCRGSRPVFVAALHGGARTLRKCGHALLRQPPPRQCRDPASTSPAIPCSCRRCVRLADRHRTMAASVRSSCCCPMSIRTAGIASMPSG